MSQHLKGDRGKHILGIDDDVVICRPLFVCLTPIHLAIASSIRWSTAS